MPVNTEGGLYLPSNFIIKMSHIKKIWLAPIDEFTNVVFRTFAKNLGYDVTISEMCHPHEISFKGIHEPNIFLNKKGEYGIQLIGKIDKLISYLSKNDKELNYINKNCDFINLNFGCPSKRVVGNKEGSYMLKYPNKIKEYILKLNKITHIPINIKIRLGFEKDNSDEILKEVKDIVNLVIIHGRTKKQGYSGKANWKRLKEIKEKYREITFVGNGDLNYKNINHKSKGFEEIMVGRYALKNPDVDSNYKNKKEMFLDFIKLWKSMENYYKNNNEIIKRQFKSSVYKRILMSFSKGMENSSKLRRDISKLKEKKKITKTTMNFLK